MIPDYQTLMLPVLEYLSNGKEHTTKDLREAMAREFKITDEARKQLLPSGRKPVFDNRVSWACTYLKKAKLIESPKRGIIKITHRGQKVLKSNPSEINNQFLLQFEEFRGFFAKEKADPVIDKTQTKELVKTPRETLSESYELIRKELAEELLEQVMKCSPDFFENLVVKLLVAMGYGGSLEDAGQRVGGTGDGGIDGVIKEDKLGLSQIYIQAKRWDKTVGSPEIQQFAGAWRQIRRQGNALDSQKKAGCCPGVILAGVHPGEVHRSLMKGKCLQHFICIANPFALACIAHQSILLYLSCLVSLILPCLEAGIYRKSRMFSGFETVL
ncbi:restriction endonuclease [Thermoactinomyces daqus]|uniref:Restriction endonuclease n=1 Tax=Thermoactinomyces daqus TaxID=1329516 RepID=A0A7W2AJ98_9BACL|nr:winged helix-turn-helix domain-containing protein [Thermoactinomyces daqus]MBA4544095.1 restriction endonuclease [Thermoactinomyces daqus]